MTGIEAMEIAHDSVTTLMWVVGPIMIVGLLIGVAISLLQALTQVQEMTLVFVPKALVMFLCLLVVLPLMADFMQSYMLRIVKKLIVE